MHIDSTDERDQFTVQRILRMTRTRKLQLALTFILLEAIHAITALGDFSCLDGWSMNPANGQCYHVSEQYASFDVAEQSCKEMSSSLASIHSVNEHLFILPLLFIERTACSSHYDCLNYWIGLRKEVGQWVWTDGSAMSHNMSLWEKESSSQTGDLHCGQIKIDDVSGDLFGYWKNENCKKPMRYICKKVSDCPDGFFRVPDVNHCYKLNYTLLTFDDASTMCEKSHPRSRLATVTSPTETDAVTKFLKIEFLKNSTFCVSDTRHKQGAWIGGQRIEPNRCHVPFVWRPTSNIELPMLYTNWYYKQPDCGSGNENCMHISQGWNYQWNDEQCNSMRCSLCQASF